MSKRVPEFVAKDNWSFFVLVDNSLAFLQASAITKPPQSHHKELLLGTESQVPVPVQMWMVPTQLSITLMRTRIASVLSNVTWMAKSTGCCCRQRENKKVQNLLKPGPPCPGSLGPWEGKETEISCGKEQMIKHINIKNILKSLLLPNQNWTGNVSSHSVYGSNVTVRNI